MRRTTCYCYILECADGSYYTGWTTEPERRLSQHNRGRGSRYTRGRLPVRLVYVEPQADRAAAMRREYAVKVLTRRQKRELVHSMAQVQTTITSVSLAV